MKERKKHMHFDEESLLTIGRYDWVEHNLKIVAELIN